MKKRTSAGFKPVALLLLTALLFGLPTHANQEDRSSRTDASSAVSASSPSEHIRWSTLVSTLWDYVSEQVEDWRLRKMGPYGDPVGQSEDREDAREAVDCVDCSPPTTEMGPHGDPVG